jgi:glycosyltransferase involved in cell wall biosynthesis
MHSVTLLIPTLNEAKIFPTLIAGIAALDPQPFEILIVDGMSDDDTQALALKAGFRVVQSPARGRGAQLNYGVAAARGDVVCVLHADSRLAQDAISLIQQTMQDSDIALASFMPRIAGPTGTRWGTSFHNWIKTWYAPLLWRPHLFIRGVRLLFGDHAMFFRTKDFLSIGGCDERLAIMEEADLCIKFAKLGKIRMLRRWVWTSDRRIAAWGPLKANLIYFKVGILWSVGVRERLGNHYPPIR